MCSIDEPFQNYELSERRESSDSDWCVFAKRDNVTFTSSICICLLLLCHINTLLYINPIIEYFLTKVQVESYKCLAGGQLKLINDLHEFSGLVQDL